MKWGEVVAFRNVPAVRPQPAGRIERFRIGGRVPLATDLGPSIRMSQTCPAPIETIETLLRSVEESLPHDDRRDFRETLEDAHSKGGVVEYVRILRSWDVYARLRAEGHLADALNYRPWGSHSEADAVVETEDLPLSTVTARVFAEMNRGLWDNPEEDAAWADW